MKRRIVPLAKQVADAEAAVVARQGQPYLDALYRSNRFEGKKFELMGMLERLGVLNFELGKLSGTGVPTSPAPVAAPTSTAGALKQEGPAVVVPLLDRATSPSPPAPPMTMATKSEPAAQPSPESLRALAAVLWPTENVQDLEGISRRVWFDGLQVPGFDRATLDAKYGETRPKPKGHSRILTAMDQAKFDAFFKTQEHSASAEKTTAAPSPSVPDLAQLRLIAATVLPGRDYWNMETAEIHKILWQEHLSVPGMDESALAAKYWRPTMSTITIAKVVRAQRQSHLEKLLTEKRVF